MKRWLSLLLAILIFATAYPVEGSASTDNIVYQKEDNDSKVTVVHKGIVPFKENKVMQLDEDGDQIFASTYAVTLEKKKSATVLDTTGSYSVIATIFLPKTTGLASPQIDGYNDHESIERKRASPFYDAVLPARHRECSSNKHGYYKALPT